MIRIHREDFLDAREQEDAPVRFPHHRTALTQGGVVRSGIPTSSRSVKKSRSRTFIEYPFLLCRTASKAVGHDGD